MPRTLFLHVLMSYVCFLTFLRPVDAVLESGVAYRDNYDPRAPNSEESEWQKRSHGAGVIEVKADRVSAPRGEALWGVAPPDGEDSTDDSPWGKRGTNWDKKRGDSHISSDPSTDSTVAINWTKEKRMERANGDGGPISGGDAQEGSEWGKRDFVWTAPQPHDTDGQDWTKRGEIDWTAPPVDENDGQDWTKRENDWSAPPSEDNDSTSMIKRLVASIWPRALGKRAAVDPNLNQPCVYIIGADGPSDGGSGPCKPGKRGDTTDGQHQNHRDDTDDFIWNKRADAEIGPGPGADTNGGNGERPDETHDWLMKRDGTVPFQALTPFAPSVGQVLKMNKRGEIEEWMHPHFMEKRQSCQNRGYAPCPNANHCCPSPSQCCPSGCKTDPTNVCCPGYNCPAGAQCSSNCGGCLRAGFGCCPGGKFTCPNGQTCCPDGCTTTGSKCCAGGGSCPAGRKCCEDGCALEGEECCRGGGACGVGNICVWFKGRMSCCTDLRCTAHVSDGVRIGATPTPKVEQPDPTPTPPPTTAAPDTSTQVVDVYYTYYWTITWRYYFYYYVYWAVQDVSTVTSSETTIYTTVSITDTASEAASSKFEAISSSVEAQFTTPAEATTALATPTLPANTAGNAPTETGDGKQTTVTTEPEETGTETPVPLPTQTTSRTTRSLSSITGPVAGDGPPVTGASAGMVVVNRWLSWSMIGVAMVAGVGMVWL